MPERIPTEFEPSTVSFHVIKNGYHVFLIIGIKKSAIQQSKSTKSEWITILVSKMIPKNLVNGNGSARAKKKSTRLGFYNVFRWSLDLKNNFTHEICNPGLNHIF
jgi:hypothetical protein